MPASQFVHVDAADSELNVPKSHSEHGVLKSFDLYDPGAQERHTPTVCVDVTSGAVVSSTVMPSAASSVLRFSDDKSVDAVSSCAGSSYCTLVSTSTPVSCSSLRPASNTSLTETIVTSSGCTPAALATPAMYLSCTASKDALDMGILARTFTLAILGRRAGGVSTTHFGRKKPDVTPSGTTGTACAAPNGTPPSCARSAAVATRICGALSSESQTSTECILKSAEVGW